ncbi:unnamed protein product [Trichobilharzia regenti]|nr:unnamed protein product [Trichobilharzia regenti]
MRIVVHCACEIWLLQVDLQQLDRLWLAKNLYIEARGIQFSDAEDEDNEDDGEGRAGEESLRIDEGLLDQTELQFQQFSSQYHKWMEATDVSSCDESSLDDDNNEDTDNNNNKSGNLFQNNNNNNNEDDLNYTVTRRKVISPQTMISRRLEYILLQSACHSKICGLPFKRDKIIFTSKTRLKKTPSVPVGGKICNLYPMCIRTFIIHNTSKPFVLVSFAI